jgi:diguanylate cyclase (GGDEF)-like protein
MDTPDISQGKYKRIFGVLFHLTKLVNSGAPLPELLQAVAQAAADLVGADTCSIMLLDDARAELLGKAQLGLDSLAEPELRFKVGEGVAGWVAERGAPALIEDVAGDARYKVLEGQTTPIVAMLCVPLATREGVIGTIAVTSSRKGAFTLEHQELLSYLGGSIVKDIENARLYRLSITDSLTKAYNRQYLFQRLPDEIERARRYGDPLSLLLFDVDHFQAFNEKHSHAAGDFVLKEIVRVVQSVVRDVDGVVRYGGEEFLLLLPKTDLAGAALLAERIRTAVQSAELPWSSTHLKVTVSLGVAQLVHGDTDEALLRRVDDALQSAKVAGHNRVGGGPA